MTDIMAKAYHHKTREFSVPCRMLRYGRKSRVIGNDVDGDLGGTEIMHISLVGNVFIGEVSSLLNRLGSRCQEEIDLRM